MKFEIKYNRYSRKKHENDLFSIQKYQSALVEFINHSHTPLTIALQGEWGSGKTSLMNLLDDELWDKGAFYRVWINSWQYALLPSCNKQTQFVRYLLNRLVRETL